MWFERILAAGGRTRDERVVAEEKPVAIECNGIGYAVLMATPADLGDLAYGFALTERLVDSSSDIIDWESHDTDRGIVVRLTLAPHLAGRIIDRVRHRTSDSSCGMCGIENLEQALRPLPRLPGLWQGTDAAIFRALGLLESRQPLSRATRATHGAAFCSRQGDVRMVREDVGRHNAFDKLIGAMLRAGKCWDGGFALLTSRCSYELVEKAVLARCPLLATISAPTRLALERAAEANLPLRTVVRADAMLQIADV